MDSTRYHKKRFEFQTASVLHTIQNFLHLQVVIVGNSAVGKSSMIQFFLVLFFYHVEVCNLDQNISKIELGSNGLEV